MIKCYVLEIVDDNDLASRRPRRAELRPPRQRAKVVARTEVKSVFDFIFFRFEKCSRRGEREK